MIVPLVKNEEVFLLIYRKSYYHNFYPLLQPDINDKSHSYKNYCSMFNCILNSKGPVPLD
ncbi:hypothetical protein PGT21_015482 [Puccinia graminis f. sp. tritici]|uniref:Uncharacterized protein n=1 Tax=Puccinia graminis f. sp. tritici TaxID=56615 RepID=A0A5B0PCR9_PUCGR|nr:hypothetical protein PGT21_015482 [Puccinia graminis f. sp. tritici]